MSGTLQRYAFVIVFTAILISGVLIYGRHLTTNPPGFFIDESSVAYNAFTISESGCDEYGARWPLYFRAFGDYKNPVFIYLLALIFRFTGPNILVARMLSAAFGLVGAMAIGLIGYRLTKQRWLAAALMLMTLATPWLFVLSRTVVEVALYPLTVALFLLAVARVNAKPRWSWMDAAWMALTLALLTYTYSIGRLLAPMLALGLVLFVRKSGMFSVGRAWLLYAASLLPLLIFRWQHPGALEGRFNLITWLTPDLGFAATAKTFVQHYLSNINPWRMLATGDPANYQIDSTHGTAPVLLVTFMLAVMSVCLLIRQRRFSAWWLLVIYGLFVSAVPASLTREYFHILRLSPVPVFLIVLTIPAVEWLMQRQTRVKQAMLAFAIVLTCGQAIYFQVINDRRGREPFRMNMFDADYPTRILSTARSASQSDPIYIKDTPAIPGYIQARWYATLEHLPLDKLVVLPPDGTAPDGAIVISTEAICGPCEVLFERSPYRVYRVTASVK